MTSPTEQYFEPGPENRDGPVYEFLLRTICAYSEKTGKMLPMGEGMRIEFKVNGVDCDFMAIVDQWHAAVEEYTEQKAAKLAVALVEGKVIYQLDELVTILDVARRAIRGKVEEMFPEADFDE